MSYYPDRHHPVFFLENALRAEGADVSFAGRGPQTDNCWGLVVNGRVVVYLIDNRWLHERQHEDAAARRLLEQGALVCHAQRPDQERVGGEWLPLAVTPGYAPPAAPVEKLYDVGFVGYVRDAWREAMLRACMARFRTSIAQGVFGVGAVHTYHTARVGLNVPTNYGDPLAYDVPMRVPEVLATGTPLLTNALDDLAALGLVDSVNCVTYAGMSDMLEKACALINDPDAAARIGTAGVAWAQANTYAHRARQILEWLNA